MTIGQFHLDTLARRLGITGAAARAGLSASAVSRHLAGDRSPNRAARHAYATKLGISEPAWDTQW